jgi:hypothetical protein
VLLSAQHRTDPRNSAPAFPTLANIQEDVGCIFQLGLMARLSGGYVTAPDG